MPAEELRLDDRIIEGFVDDELDQVETLMGRRGGGRHRDSRREARPITPTRTAIDHVNGLQR
ncbi:hypothetical protein [Streptomyces parvus]|uniref:hypothetical protein n=1 Tax=Streptomyces parvus TaxID=66428 RepID=UPI0033C93B46